MIKLTPRQSAIVSVLDKELAVPSLDLNGHEEKARQLIRDYLILERCYSPEVVEEYIRYKTRLQKEAGSKGGGSE